MDNRSSDPKKNISELPKDIIQHIQSLFEPKEAIRMILISKSWLQAWSTRPFLDFDQHDLRLKDVITGTFTYLDVSGEVVDRTLKRYAEHGIGIAKLRLRLNTTETRWLELVVPQNNLVELDLTSTNGRLSTQLLTEHWREIFMIKSLQVLRVNYNPSSKLVLSGADIKCRNLKKLELHWVYIDYVTFQHIMFCCPLIQELLLYYCGLFNLSNSNNDTTGEFEGKFANLKRLSLDNFEINEAVQTILSNIPQLEDLTLIRCPSFSKPINLSSLSLKRAEIVTFGWAEIIIDAPNLHMLKYELKWERHCRETLFPTIISPAIEGEINLNIRYSDTEIDPSWFHGLTKSLSNFAKSNVKFTFEYYPHRPIHVYPLIVNVQPANLQPFSLAQSRHQVDSLTFSVWFPCYGLLDAFFTICHPKTLLFEGKSEACNLESLRGLCEHSAYRWYQGNELECCKLDQNMCRRHNIKDAKLYRVVDNQQKPLQINELDDEIEKESYRPMVISVALEWECSD